MAKEYLKHITSLPILSNFNEFTSGEYLKILNRQKKEHELLELLCSRNIDELREKVETEFIKKIPPSKNNIKIKTIQTKMKKMDSQKSPKADSNLILQFF